MGSGEEELDMTKEEVWWEGGERCLGGDGVLWDMCR